MAPKTYVLLLAAASSLVHCDLTFVRLAHNGVWQEPTRYIRNKSEPFVEPTNPHPARWYNDPSFYLEGESVYCGRANMYHANSTEVLKVKAGDEIEFAHNTVGPKSWTSDMWSCPDNRGSCVPNSKTGMVINVIGPVIAHLSKVPAGMDIHAWNGNGEWTKIYTMGFRYRPNETEVVDWLPYNHQQAPAPHFVVTIPRQTPAGQYLLRISLQRPGTPASTVPGGWPVQELLSFMYPSCAQIEVQSEYSGSLPKGGTMPPMFNPEGPGNRVSAEMYAGTKVDDAYEYPGGPIWDGEELRADRPDLTSKA